MAEEEMSSSKTCMTAICPIKSIRDNQISEMLSLSCIAMQKQLIGLEKSTSQFSLLLGALCKRITHSSALHRTVSAIVFDESHSHSRRKTLLGVA